MAGPIMRAALNDVELSATALESRRSETSSATKVWRAGASNAVTHPSRNAKTYTCQSCTTPVTVSRPSPSASTAWADCVTSRSLRRSKWSAAKPVKGKSTIAGPNCSAITMPTAVALCGVSSASTIQSWAVRCIQVPTLETNAPLAQRR